LQDVCVIKLATSSKQIESDFRLLSHSSLIRPFYRANPRLWSAFAPSISAKID
jgi:hypothetical protein